MNPLDRLAYVGRHGMGALRYEPELDLGNTDDAPLALDKLARESAAVLAGENEEVFEELLRLNGSSSGARPKIVAQVSTDRKAIIHGRQDLQRGFTHWMIKFPSSQGARDVGAIEYAYSLMAKDAGVEMPETHLFRTKRNKYFGTKRFDRNGDARIHMHSLGGLIHADHRSPSLDYDMVLRVSLALTRNIQDAEKAYALVCFNVLAHNRDDHAKNFSFLLNARNEWIFAPAYDLVYSYGPGGEQSMLVLGEGRNPGAVQLQALGKQHGLKNAPEILAKVKRAVADRLAKRYGLIPPDGSGIYGPGETLTYACQRLLTRNTPAREFSRSMISKNPFANAVAPPNDAFKRLAAGEFRDWRLVVDGTVAHPMSLSLADLKSLGLHSQITEVACEEGWSYIAEWIGTPLSVVLREAGVLPQTQYVDPEYGYSW
jgi:hypothetical protein